MIKKLESFYLKYIPGGWGVYWLVSYFILNSTLWIVEHAISAPHVIYLHDVVIVIVWLIIGLFIYFIGYSANSNWKVYDYDKGIKYADSTSIILVQKKKEKQ